MEIPDNWLPTPSNINALPEPLRRYIHALETCTDPAGDVRRIAELKSAASGVEAMYRSAKDELRAAEELLSSLWRVDDGRGGWIVSSATEALATIEHMGGAYIEPVAQEERGG